MKWIKYQIAYDEAATVLITKKIGYSEANLTIAQNEAYQGSYTIVDDAQTFAEKPLPIESGGTNAKTLAAAKTNLGITAIETWKEKLTTGETSVAVSTTANALKTGFKQVDMSKGYIQNSVSLAAGKVYVFVCHIENAPSNLVDTLILAVTGPTGTYYSSIGSYMQIKLLYYSASRSLGAYTSEGAQVNLDYCVYREI